MWFIVERVCCLSLVLFVARDVLERRRGREFVDNQQVTERRGVFVRQVLEHDDGRGCPARGRGKGCQQGQEAQRRGQGEPKAPKDSPKDTKRRSQMVSRESEEGKNCSLGVTVGQIWVTNHGSLVMFIPKCKNSKRVTTGTETLSF